MYPSNDVVKILKTCERIFRCNVSGYDFHNPLVIQKKNLKAGLRMKVLRELPANLFSSLERHDVGNEFGMAEDLHSTQLTKTVIDRFFQIRLLRYAQYVTQKVIRKGKHGMRQQSNKLTLFKGL